MYKVFLTGGDSVKWATADDFNLLKKCLTSFCEFTNLEDCDIIHSVNWYALLDINFKYLSKRYVITHIPHDVKSMLMQPNYLKVRPFVDKWIVMSRRAKIMLESFGLDGEYVPYPIDLEKFHKIDKSMLKLDQFRKKYKIPTDKYLIGSFQRDTEGADLITPKYVKGPDVFFEIVKALYNCNKDISVILAGPRRFWLIKQLLKYSIPFVYVGKVLQGSPSDDLKINTLTQEDINFLYNIIDLYLVSSRMEGGPKAIIECTAAKCKIISTNVGQASDILTSNTIYLDSIEAVDLIVTDIQSNILLNAVEGNYGKLVKEHNLKNIEKYWKRIYRVLIKKELKSKVLDGKEIDLIKPF
jgi:hypothetical protein